MLGERRQSQGEAMEPAQETDTSTGVLETLPVGHDLVVMHRLMEMA